MNRLLEILQRFGPWLICLSDLFQCSLQRLAADGHQLRCGGLCLFSAPIDEEDDFDVWNPEEFPGQQSRRKEMDKQITSYESMSLSKQTMN